MTVEINMPPDGTASIAKDSAEMTTLSVAQKELRPKNLFPPTTIDDIRAIPHWAGRVRTVEEISSLNEDAFRQIFAEQKLNARG